MLKKYLLVGLGGFLGAIARYELGGIFKVGSGYFPAGTFFINLTGSFVLGLFFTLISEKYVVPVEVRLFFGTGFVGAYTTFSSFTNETVTLFRQGFGAVGLVYAVASLAGGLLCVWLGLLVARRVAFGSFFLDSEMARRLKLQEHSSLPHTGSLPIEERNELDLDLD